MKYLLDVNSLLALAVLNHEFHSRVAAWVDGLAAKGILETGNVFDHRTGICSCARPGRNNTALL